MTSHDNTTQHITSHHITSQLNSHHITTINSHDNSQLTLHPQRTVIAIHHTTHIRTAERRFPRTLLKVHTVQPILLACVVPTQERSALRTRHHRAALLVRRGTRAVFALHLAVQTLGVRLAVAAHDRTRAVATEPRFGGRTHEEGCVVFAGSDQRHRTRVVLVLLLTRLLQHRVVLVVAQTVVVLPQRTVERAGVTTVEEGGIGALTWRHVRLCITRSIVPYDSRLQLPRHTPIVAGSVAEQRQSLLLKALCAPTRSVAASHHHLLRDHAMGTQRLALHARAVAAHDLTSLTTHYRTQLRVARTTAVTAQEPLTARTARRRRAERAVLCALARRTAERRVRGTLDERWTICRGRTADVAGTEHGQRHGTHGQKRTQREVGHAAAVGAGELEWREMGRDTVLEGQRTE